MKSANALRQKPLLEVVLLGLLFLLFFQLISDFVEAIYVFGLLGTSIPPEIASVLLLLSPVLLLLLPRGLSGWPLVLAGELMLVCRVVEAALDPRAKMLVAGLGVACFLVFFPSLLRGRQEPDAESGGRAVGLGLAVGLSLSILFRTLGSGSDITAQGGTQAIGWALALAAGVLLPLLLLPARVAGAPGGPGRLSVWRTIGLCLGLVNVLVLCYFAFASPAVIARWTGASYLPIVSTAAGVVGLSGLLLALVPRLPARLGRRTLVAWNLAFGLCLVLTILPHNLPFPSDPGAYPLAANPAASWLHLVPLTLTLLLCPVLLVDMARFAGALAAGRPAPRTLGAGFSLAGLYLLLIIFAQVFTTVYDYIPVVGPLFRDKFWLVFLVPCLLVTLPALLVSRRAPGSEPEVGKLRPGWAVPTAVCLAALGTVAGALLTAARPVPPSGPQTSLKVLTYNIQQGYDPEGRRSYAGQLDLIRRVDADLVGLQECDTARIANGNADVVRTFADRLDLYSYYGPKTAAGTFGIALLSKYPIENPRTFYMYSEGEQTATIWAQVRVGAKLFNVFVTHLGNGGPIVQQEAILKEVEGKGNVLLMGDFNFRPDSEQYRLTTATLADAWFLRWPGGSEDQGVDPARTIDHVFVSPGMQVTDALYLPGPYSDHPALTVSIAW